MSKEHAAVMLTHNAQAEIEFMHRVAKSYSLWHAVAEVTPLNISRNFSQYIIRQDTL